MGMTYPVEKTRSTGNERVFLTERGASFGYTRWLLTTELYRSCGTLGQSSLMEHTRSNSPRPQEGSAAASLSLFLCWRARQSRQVLTACSLKFITIRRMPNRTEQRSASGQA